MVSTPLGDSKMYHILRLLWTFKGLFCPKLIFKIKFKTGADPENSERGGPVPHPPTPLPPNDFRTCNNKVTLMFQKHFENTGKEGGPSSKSAYARLLLSLKLKWVNEPQTVINQLKILRCQSLSWTVTIFRQLISSSPRIVFRFHFYRLHLANSYTYGVPLRTKSCKRVYPISKARK